MSNTDTDKLNRLWAYGLHVDNIFNDRLNLFLVSQSLLLGSVALMRGTQGNDASLLRLVIVLGLILTFLWSLVQIKQAKKISVVRHRLLELDDDFRETDSQYAKGIWRIPSTRILSYGMPLVIAALWIALWF